jgi:hypothetical protein
MSYYLAPCLVSLRDEINTRWPERDKGSDGWIGDPTHAARVSDHNPDSKGCVHAIDVDVDGIDVDLLLKQVIGDPRVWYVIFDRRIYSRTYGWAARVYTGTNPHTAHVHVSIRYDRAYEDNTATWLGPTRPRRTKGGKLPTVDLSNVLARIEDGHQAHDGIARIQAALNNRYGFGLEVDGHWGRDTTTAYRQHERAIQSPRPEGTPGQRSLSELGRGRFRVVA